MPSLTLGEEDSVELEAAAVLQPTGQLAEVTAVQVQSDPQGLSAALHLVTHRRVCKRSRGQDCKFYFSNHCMHSALITLIVHLINKQSHTLMLQDVESIIQQYFYYVFFQP